MMKIWRKCTCANGLNVYGETCAKCDGNGKYVATDTDKYYTPAEYEANTGEKWVGCYWVYRMIGSSYATGALGAMVINTHYGWEVSKNSDSLKHPLCALNQAAPPNDYVHTEVE